MDEEEIERKAMQFLALSALGDFLLLLGLLFLFLGAAAYLSEYFAVKGSGEISVGVLLVGAAFVLFIVGRMVFPERKAGIGPGARSRPPAGDEEYR